MGELLFEQIPFHKGTPLNRYNYIKKLKEIKEYYIKYSKNKEKEQKDYLNKRIFKNNVIGELVKVEYNLLKKYRYDSLYYLNVVDYLNELTDKEDLTPVFITLTSPSELHLFKKINNKKYVLNEKYENIKELKEELKKCKRSGENSFVILNELTKSIKKSYKLLQNETREIIRNYQRSSKTKNIYYFKMFEYHKSFTPHIHLMIFVKEAIKDKLIKLIEKRTKKNNIKQYDIKILNKEEKRNGSKYISKYITKTLLSDNMNDLYFLDGWKRYNKIRFFSFSRIGIPRLVFNKIIKYKDLINIDNKDNFINYFKELTKRTFIKRFNGLDKKEFTILEKEELKNYNISNGNFLVFLNVDKYEKNRLEEERKLKIFKLETLFKRIRTIKDLTKRFIVFKIEIENSFFEEVKKYYDMYFNYNIYNDFIHYLDFVSIEDFNFLSSERKESIIISMYRYLKDFIDYLYTDWESVYKILDYKIYFKENGEYKLLYYNKEIEVII